jgi:hypothetical protein
MLGERWHASANPGCKARPVECHECHKPKNATNEEAKSQHELSYKSAVVAVARV